MTEIAGEGEAGKPRCSAEESKAQSRSYRVGLGVNVHGKWLVLLNWNCVKDVQGEEAVGNVDFQTQERHDIWKYVLEREQHLCSNRNSGPG